MKTITSRGFAFVPVLIWIGIVGGGGFAGWKIWQAFSPNEHKKQVVAVDTQAQALAAQANENVAKLTDALNADQAAMTAEKKREQDAAGFIYGASSALLGEPTPTVGVRVASELVTDAANTLDPATTVQKTQYDRIVAEMKAQNAQLTSELIEQKKQSAADKASANSWQTQAKVSDDAAKLTAAQLASEAANHKADVDQLNQRTSDDKTIIQRVESFGIGGSVLLLVVVPLLLFAFPELLPLFKSLTTPLLGLWHKLWSNLLAAEKNAHAATIQALASEQAAHAATKAALVTISTAAVTAPQPLPKAA